MNADYIVMRNPLTIVRTLLSGMTSNPKGVLPFDLWP